MDINEKVRGLLAPHEDNKALECDGFTRVASYLLTENNIEHTVMMGSLTLGDVMEPHFWIVLFETDHIIDYRARMWFGEHDEVPHGVFLPWQWHDAVYAGTPVTLMVNKFVYEALTGDFG